MDSEANNQTEDSPAQSKTLIVLGVTFILPIIITLIAVYIMI
ncbi:hypothetical protein [Bdellovibrio sp. HCB209]